MNHTVHTTVGDSNQINHYACKFNRLGIAIHSVKTINHIKLSNVIHHFISESIKYLHFIQSNGPISYKIIATS